MIRSIALACLALLAGCGSQFTANEYAARAVQQANPVQQGVIAGSRRVAIAAGGEAGAAAGAAAGGVVGSAASAGNSVSSALGAVGGALVGGLIGTTAERSTSNTDAVEYIIRRADGELVSVTQRDAVPIPLGTRVLVITGNQARVVPDYTGQAVEPPPRAPGRRPQPRPTEQAPAAAPPAPIPPLPIPPLAIPLLPMPPVTEALPDLPLAPLVPPPAETMQPIAGPGSSR